MRECQGSTEVDVNHQPTHCRPSTEADPSSLSRRHTVWVEPPKRIELLTYALRVASGTPEPALRRLNLFLPTQSRPIACATLAARLAARPQPPDSTGSVQLVLRGPTEPRRLPLLAAVA